MDRISITVWEKYRIENNRKKSTKPNAGSSQTSTKFTNLNKIDKEGKKRQLKLLKSGMKEGTLLSIIQKKDYKEI